MTLEQLQPFCSTDPSRQQIHAPFTMGDHTYATDGRIMVRVPAISNARLFNLKKAKEHFTVPILTKKARAIPELPACERNTCTTCHGHGKLTHCKECDGEGSKPCECCGQDVGCKACEGLGYIIYQEGDELTNECDDCDGLGYEEVYETVAIGGVHFNPKYLALIRDLPGLQFFPQPSALPACFIFDGGGEGRLMPMIKN